MAISYTETTFNTKTWWADVILGHGPKGVQHTDDNLYTPEKVTMPESI